LKKWKSWIDFYPTFDTFVRWLLKLLFPSCHRRNEWNSRNRAISVEEKNIWEGRNMFFRNFLGVESCREKKRSDNRRSARDAEFRMLIQHLFSHPPSRRPIPNTILSGNYIVGKVLQNERTRIYYSIPAAGDCSTLDTRVSCVPSNSSNTKNINTWLRGDLYSISTPSPSTTRFYFSQPGNIFYYYWNDVIVFCFLSLLFFFL
jgi:hypothetical protein